MKHYRDRALQLLVATDVAARGIDVSDVSHVINYQLPDETELYTHRSGRTARAGKSGITISIINTKDLYKIRQIEKQLNTKFIYSRIPAGVEICEQQLISLMKKIRQVEINEKGIAKYLPSIFEEFKDIDKNELLIRVVSIEFNRFLDYYRNAVDMNIDFSKKDHGRTKENARAGSSMFINLGTMDGFDNSRMLSYLMEMTGLPADTFGRINMKGIYTFVDIKEGKIDEVLNSFKNEVYNGRKVRVDASQGKQDKKSENSDKNNKFEKPKKNKEYSRDRSFNKRKDEGQKNRRRKR